jgi:hypothetical protein
MSVAWAETVVGAVALYGAIGVAFAAVFLAIGLRRVDPVAEAGPLRFKLLIAPGIAVLWPLMLVMLFTGSARDA